MIKAYVLNITEGDDIEMALEELQEQMAGITLSNHTVGIASVSADYMESGVYAAVANSLPFTLVGNTTLAIATQQEAGTFLFSIMVLINIRRLPFLLRGK
jgi:hypothetical protein